MYSKIRWIYSNYCGVFNSSECFQHHTYIKPIYWFLMQYIYLDTKKETIIYMLLKAWHNHWEYYLYSTMLQKLCCIFVLLLICSGIILASSRFKIHQIAQQCLSTHNDWILEIIQKLQYTVIYQQSLNNHFEFVLMSLKLG